MNIASDNSAFAGILQTRLNQRGEKLVVDRHAGKLTLAALDRRFPDRSPTTTATTTAAAAAPVVTLTETMSSSARHYALALAYKGVKELAGPGTNPILVPMWDLCPSWLNKDDSKTAWCGIFRGWIGHKAGTGLPAEHYRALNWSNWGTAVDLKKPSTWHQGDTIIMPRPGGYHVTLLERTDGVYAWCLGGNQSNSVNITPYLVSEISAVRR